MGVVHTDDYQNREGNSPQSGVPDSVRVETWTGKTEVLFDFKSTSSEECNAFVEKWCKENGIEYSNIETFQGDDSEYENDWNTTSVTVHSINTNGADTSNARFTEAETISGLNRSLEEHGFVKVPSITREEAEANFKKRGLTGEEYEHAMNIATNYTSYSMPSAPPYGMNLMVQFPNDDTTQPVFAFAEQFGSVDVQEYKNVSEFIKHTKKNDVEALNVEFSAFTKKHCENGHDIQIVGAKEYGLNKNGDLVVTYTWKDNIDGSLSTVKAYKDNDKIVVLNENGEKID